jgi:hypothetical protein
MAGYEHTANDTIEDLRRNLRDRYKDCHAVLKELIQNADDAAATELQIAWLPGLPSAQHVLLRGSQLLIVNNGRFSYKDSYAIHLAGAGSKGNDEGKIGKFGLGLKSVFHLCEAYFYLSDRGGDEESAEPQLKKYGRRGVLNPWEGERYAGWDTFGEADQALLETVVDALRLKRGDGGGWFALCLPLRTEAHCREALNDNPADWAIEPKYYGQVCHAPPEDVFAEDRVAGIRHMLPLMSTLEAVRFKQFGAGADGTPTLVAEVSRSALQHVDWRRLTPGVHAVAGHVDVAWNGSRQRHAYAGRQILLQSDTLDSLPKHAEWPRMDTQTDTGRKRGPAAVKQHAAVVVFEQLGKGALKVDRAVFLPLGDPPHAECQILGSHDYDLILHGYFFVDAGRRGVDFAADGRPTLRQQWNAQLYREGTLPLLIPALESFSNTISAQPDASVRLQRLTTLLNHPECHFWRDHASDICGKSAWCFRLAGGTGSWASVPRDMPVVLLPGHDVQDSSTPFDVFPSLKSLAERHVVSLAGLPRLATTALSNWPVDFTVELLESVLPAQAVRDARCLEHLCRVCEVVKTQPGNAPIDPMIALLRRMFSEVPLAHLRERQSELARLVACVPSERILAIPFNEKLVTESDRLFKLLSAESTDVLVVPSPFAFGHAKGAKLSTADALKLLQRLSTVQPSGSQEELFHSLVGQAISEVLLAWPQSSTELLAVAGNLPIFYSRNYSTEKRARCSASELEGALKENRLFAVNAGLCPRLQAAVDGVEVMYLLGDKALNDQLAAVIGNVPGCDAASCASLLLKRPALVEAAEPRVALLKELLRGPQADADDRLRVASRYLLHRHRADSGEAQLLTGDAGAWTALARIVLESGGAGWRLIAKPLLDNVTNVQMEWLGLGHVSPTAVAGLLAADAITGTLDCTSVNSNEAWRNEIVANWPEAAKERLKRLPIFQRVDGHFGEITRHTFIRGNLPLPPREVFPKLELVEDPTGVIAQRHLAPSLAPADVVSTALDDPSCHLHWRFILETIPEERDHTLSNKLRTSRWLPDRDGAGRAPSEVVTHNVLRRYVAFLQGSDRAVIHVDDLAIDLRQHPRVKFATEFCPTGKELFQLLGSALSHAPAFWVGERVIDEKSLSTFINEFSGEDGDSVMPSAHLLYLLEQEVSSGSQWLSQHILPAIRHPVEADRYRRILSYLSRRHQHAAAQDRNDILDLFNRYLAEAARRGELSSLLSDIHLLNRHAQWVSPSSLAMRGENIAAQHLVASEHEAALKEGGEAEPSQSDDGASPIPFKQFDQQALASSAEMLGKFLDMWRSDEIPDDAIAAVVSVLGDNDGYPAQYERLRDARTLSAMRGLFSWHPSGPGWRLHELMSKQHFCVLPADAATVLATNLLGDPFDAPVSARLECLFDGFDGRSYFSMPNDERCYLLRLRRIDPVPLSAEDRLTILAKSILTIRSLIHRQADEDFQSVWSQITNLGQLDIEIAQELILESSAMLLETQLSIRSSAQLKALFSRWHHVRQRSKTATTPLDKDEANRERGEVLEELRALLREDRPTQLLLVGEIRKRLEAASYNASSIPFELFQNADDAIVELEGMCEDKELLDKARPEQLRHQFIAEAMTIGSQPALRFCHWGRGINQYRIGLADRRNEGYDRDMERMLVLQGSGKDDDELADRRTGKFGLGFKSVFCVCDSPRVLSGSRSRFRVVAGVYPDRLSDADQNRLQRALEEVGDALHRGTVIELPLRDAKDAAAVLKRFRRLFGYLMVLSRRIRRCALAEPGTPSLSVEWRPSVLIPGVETGKIQNCVGQRQSVLVFRVGSAGYGAVLVPLSAQGVADEVAETVPEVWVTTPTEEPGVGRLLVNGGFDLNPGRTQLRRTEHNECLARDMGVALGKQLCDLFALSEENWPSLRDAMDCVEASAKDFWASLWHACEPYVLKGPENGVLRAVLFGSEHCGVHRLIREARALPTGLADEHHCLTRLHDVRWHLRGALAESGLWAVARRCGWVKENVPPGAVVSRSTFTVLKALCSSAAQALTLRVVVENSFSSGYFADASISHELGQFLTPELVGKLDADKHLAQEDDDLLELLSDVKFKTVAGDWRVGSELLISHGDQPERTEERRRAAFAPSDRVLDPSYDDVALEFFFSCRGEMRASAKEMATWILSAEKLETRKASLDYLERGAQHFNVAHELNELKKSVAHSWLDDTAALSAALPADPNRQAVVMGKLQKGVEFQQQHSDEPPPSAALASATQQPKAIVDDIWSWWKDNRHEIVTHHNSQIYPGGKAPRLNWAATQQQLVGDAAVRREWLILFMLGAMHRIGRATHHQHKGFLEMCVERGWIDTLSLSSDDQTHWFTIMEAYLDSLQGESEYYQWMAQFLAYYQLARWLPKYARAFEAVTRPGVNLDDLSSIGDIANLRTSHIFAGATGFDAPPCSRTLGVGAHFVLREVARLRQIDDGRMSPRGRLAPLAFVPSMRTRQLVAQILSCGDPEDKATVALLLNAAERREDASKAIERTFRKYLKDAATFDNAFDLPLLVLTWPKYADTCAELLGQAAPAEGGASTEFLAEPAHDAGEDE